MSFKERLKEKMDEKGWKAAELSRRSGVSKQNIGRILNDTPHSITGALPKTEPETILKLANPLGWDYDDALLAGGFAPTNQDVSIDSQLKQLSPNSQIIARKQIHAIIKTFVEAETAHDDQQKAGDNSDLRKAVSEDKTVQK